MEINKQKARTLQYVKTDTKRGHIIQK